MIGLHKRGHFSRGSAVDQEIGNKGTDEGEFVGVTQVVSNGGDQQDGDVGDGAMVADGGEAAHGGMLHDQGEEAGEETFDAGAFLVVGDEV